MLRHVRSNVIAYLALFLALSGGSFAIAALNRHDKRVIKKIVNKQITRRAPGLSVNHANSANEATHAGTADMASSANTADSVGNVSIEPVRISLPDGAPETDVVSVNGSFVSISNCGGGTVTLYTGRSLTGPPIVTAQINSPSDTSAGAIPPGSGSAEALAAFSLSASIRESSGHVTRVMIDGFYSQNAFGGTDDCFVQGTIERFG
jgi:hypothetical protein